MQRIMIIGSGGAGKSTLARQLGQLGIPVIHLDTLYWQPGWLPTPSADWISLQRKIIQNPCWIIDGNYGSTLDIRLEAADTIIFLDFEPGLCLWRVVQRYFRYRGKVRPDMATGCPERLTLEFLQWIWNFKQKKRPQVIRKLETYQSKVIVLQNPAQVSDFLNQTLAI